MKLRYFFHFGNPGRRGASRETTERGGEGWLECGLLGAFLMALQGLLEMVFTREPGGFWRSESVALAGWVLGLHLAVGLAAGLVSWLLSQRLRRLISSRLPHLAAGMMIGWILAFPAVERVKFLVPIEFSFAQKALIAGLTWAATLAGVLTLLWLLNRTRKDRSRSLLPWNLPRIGCTVVAVLALLCFVVPRVAFRRSGGFDSRPNILLISLDTVRADHLEVYGYSRPTSPHLADFARDAMTFDSAFAPEPWTLPSHMTMMTSLEPLVHGVRSLKTRLNPERVTLAEILRENGYNNVALVAGDPAGVIGAERGFADGFHQYHHPPHQRRKALGTSLGNMFLRLAGPATGTAEDITPTAMEFFAQAPPEPFFLFLHYYDAHSDRVKLPYEAPRELVRLFSSGPEFDGCDAMGRCATDFLHLFNACNETSIDQDVLNDIVAHYDAGIRYLDGWLGRLFADLKRHGYYNDALIIVTADHGEEFLDHGEFLHKQLHRETLRVPLMIKFPQQKHAGQRSSLPVQHIDLMPTVLDVAGVQGSGQMHGRSLLTQLGSPAMPTRPLFFSFTSFAEEGDTRFIGVQHREKKLTLALKDDCRTRGRGLVQAYDVALDPLEQSNLAGDQLPEWAGEMRHSLLRWFEESKELHARLPAGNTIRLDQIDLRKLKALGYVQ